jgi:uncharacterized protein (DUF608 family)
LNWENVLNGGSDKEEFTDGEPSGGASLFVPFKLAPSAKKTVRLMLCWHTPETDLKIGDSESPYHKPWYSAKFKNIDETAQYWKSNYEELKTKTQKFSDCFYSSDLPDEITEAISANLTILKSPTVLRQTDGRLWAWEGCCDCRGCCAGSCTHVWNYAQAIPHLFPELERTLRQTEFNENQDEKGHQFFRARLPIRPEDHNSHAAADGQLGGIMKVHREWKISGNTEWLKEIWTKVRKSLDYCIEEWDPEHNGILVEPHHNTYDIEFWGPDGMCSSFYLGALKAAVLMGKALGNNIEFYQSLYEKGRKYLENELFNGEYFIQKIQRKDLRAPNPTEYKTLAGSGKGYSAEALEILEKEGPKYQYGEGCLADGVLGAWIAQMCGVGDIIDPEKIKSHLLSVFKYNFRKDLSDHANPQRPTYALGNESGLLLCTWPKGGKLSLPFPYCAETWTGFEYQVASHLMICGCVDEALEIVRSARSRHDGRVRNPFNEYECGHWYARAMSSYGMIQGLTGIRYDAIEKTLYIKPSLKKDFKAFISTATGYGIAGIKDGKPLIEVAEGIIEIERIDF